MKRFRKINLLIILMALAAIFVVGVNAYEKDNYVVSKDEEFSVLVDLNSNSNENDNYTAVISYDQNVFDKLNKDSIIKVNKSASKIDEVDFDTKKNIISIKNTENSKIKDTVAITFKVKKDVKVKKTNIIIRNIKDSNKNKLDNKKINVTINKVNNTKTIISIILGVLIAVLGVVLIIYNMTNEDEDKKKINIIIGVVIVILLCIIAILLGSKTANKKTVEYQLEIQNKEDVRKKEESTSDTDTTDDDKNSNESRQLGLNIGKININRGKELNEEQIDTNKQPSTDKSSSTDKKPNTDKKPDTDKDKDPDKDKEPEEDIDYGFSFSDAVVSKIDLEKKEVILEFVSTNKTEHKISKVIINGEEYTNIYTEGNKYFVSIPLEDVKNKTYHIEKVILDNNKEFSKEVDTKLETFKEKPVVEDLNVKVEKEQVTLTYKMKDTSKVLTKEYVVIKNSNNEVIYKEEVGLDSKEVIIKNLTKAGEYTVEILGDFDLVDGLEHKEEVIKSYKFEKELELKVTEVNVSNKYPTKGEEIFVYYKVDTNTDDLISSFKINGKTYTTLAPNDNYYVVTYKVNDTSGKEEINLTEVEINNQKVTVNKKVTVDVLKDKPVIESYTFNDDKRIPELTFELKDKDKAFIEGKIIITDEAGSTKEIKIEKDKNTYKIEGLKEDKPYNFVVEVTYDLDSDKDNNEHLITENLINGVIEVVHNYEFTFDNLKINSINKNEKKVTLEFNSTNATEFNVDRVVINKKEYPVIKNGNTYTVDVVLENDEETKLTLSNVILENGHSFEIDKNNNYIVFKKMPTISDFEVKNNKEGELKATFKLNDTSKTVTKLYGQLRDNLGNILQTVELEKTAQEISFKDLKAGDYQIVILGDYDLVDGNTYINTVIDKKEAKVKIVLNKLQGEVNNKYNDHRNALEKDKKEAKKTIITYEIVANTLEDVKKLVINKKEYEVTKIDTNKYQVVYEVQDNYGLEKITVQKIIYDNNTIEVEKVEKDDNIKPNVEVYVLKKRPFIQNYLSSTEDYDSKTKTGNIKVTFELKDPDGALVKDSKGNIKGYATLGNFKDKDGNKTPSVKLGKNELIFCDIPEKRIFMFHTDVEYDLDDEVGKDNHYEKSLGGRATSVTPPAIINIEELVTKNKDGVTKYFNKKEEVQIEFKANVLYIDGEQSYYYPTKAVINGEEYDLVRNNDTYTATLPGEDAAKEKNYTIEALILSNLEKIKIDKNNKVTVNILKDEVSVTEFKYSEGKEEDNTIEVEATFNVVDEDDALIEGKVEIIDPDGEKVKSNPSTIEKGNNTIKFKAQSNKNYTFKVIATYDRDFSNGEENIKTDQELLVENIKVLSVKDYNFTIDNLEVNYINLDEKYAALRFNSSNSSEYELKQVEINGKKYDVRKDGDYYLVDVVIEDNKRLELNLTKAILENKKEFKQDKKIVIFKNKPVVTTLKATNKNDSQLEIEYAIDDKDKTITNLYLVVKNDTGIVKEIKINSADKKAEIPNLFADNYTVEVQADYNLVDGKTYERVVLDKCSATVKPVVNINTVSISKKYPQKAENIELVYQILSNVQQEVKSVVINNVEYNVEQISEGVYKIIYTTPNTAGVVSLNMTAVNFEDVVADISDKPYVEQIDVLKQVPSITNFSSMDVFELNTVNFNFEVVDEDGAYTSGSACVGDVCKEIKSGVNNVSFVVEPDVVHNLDINVLYDLDTDQLNGDGEDLNTGSVSFAQSFRLLKNYQLEISNLKTYKNTTLEESKYFNKGEAIRLCFESKNITALMVKRVKINDKSDKESNGEWYDVQTDYDNRGELYYYAVIGGKNEVGLQKLDIEAITLESGKEITAKEFSKKVDPVEIDIIKEAPVYSNVEITNNEKEVTVSFKVEDSDRALVESYAYVVDSNNEEIYKHKIISGENKFKVELVPGQQYNLIIQRNYNLDSIDNDNKYETDEIFLTQTLEIAKKEEANFVARHLNVEKRVPDGEKALLTFENEILTYQDVEKVRIDGVDYDVVKDGSTYKVELTPKQKGYNTVLVESVVMGGKTFKVNRNLTYVYENAIPKTAFVSDINEDLNNNLGIVEYKLQDPDKAIRKLTAYMRNSAGALVTTQDVELDAEDIKMLLLRTYRYTIELKAEYDIGDGKTLETISLFNKEKVANPRVNIIEESTEEEIVNKGEEVVLNYKINTNIDQELKRIFIGDFSYAAKKIDNDLYQISFPANKGAGAVSYKVEQMQFGNTYYDVVDPNPVVVTIRKDIPTLTHFIIDEANNSLSFKINDQDRAIVNDSVLTISDHTKTITKKLEKTKSDFQYKISELGLSLNKEYTVKVNATYDLLGNNSTKASVDKADIFEKKIKLIGNVDYGFQFKVNYDIYLMSIKEALQIGFKSSNNFNLKVNKVIIDGEEYLVTWKRDNVYEVDYKAKDIDAKSLTIEKAILENDKGFDVNQTVSLYIQPDDASVTFTNFSEDIQKQKAKVSFKVNDDDGQIRSDLKFVLKDFEGKLLETQYVKKDEESVEFNIPNPPTAKYKVEVYADKMIITDFIQENQLFATGEFDSIINTSIRDSSLSTYYPKKGEIITIDYAISSSKVVVVDPEDHSNQDNAVTITTMVINNKEYPVELQENGRYRVYYTVQNEEGLEEIKVSQINFSNDTTEQFSRVDKVDVLKEEPQIINFKTVNDLKDKKVKVSFEIVDVDNVLTNSALYAEVAGKTEPVVVGKNTIEFKVEENKLLNFAVKASYDLDSNALNNITQDQNVYNNYTIFEKPFILTGDYNVTFSDIKTYNEDNVETKYFEKDQKVNVSFKATTKYKELSLETIKINDENYKLNKLEDDTYTLKIKGSDKWGVVNANIESVTLNSGNIVPIENQKVDFEVLKDVIKVDDFEYKKVDNNADQLELDINITDKDQSYKNLRIEIKDEFGKNVEMIGNSSLTVGKNSIIFTTTDALKYFVAIYADYDRDTNKFDKTSNNYSNERIYYKIITTVRRYVEMKDVVDVELFNYASDGRVQRINSISLSDLDVISNSLVKVTMKDLPTFYSEIKSYKVENGKLLLTLVYNDAMIYTDNQLKPLVVELDILEDSSYSYKGSFKSLVEQMRAKPTGTFVLTKDYDLDDYIAESDTLVDFEFKGVIEGNGHTISNLHKPLFKKMSNAQVKDIVFKSASFGTSATSNKAVIALEANNSKIQNVHIDNITAYGGNELASFVVRANDNTIIDSCSAVNINFYTTYTSQNISGLVSVLNKSKVVNCYVQGNITSSWKYASGIASQTTDAVVENSIVNMKITPYFSHRDYEGSGGIIARGNSTLKNNISLLNSGNNIYTIYNEKYASLKADSINNYQLENSTSVKNKTNKAVIDIKSENINTDLFEKLGYSREIWNIDDVTIDKLPTLKGLTLSFTDEGEKPVNSNVYIPDYNRLSKLGTYQKNREYIYHNMYKLMPFYDAKDLITDGNKIDINSNLNKKAIKYVLPYDKNGKLVSVLTTEDYDNLGKISIVYEDGSKEDHLVDFDDYYGNVASYVVSDLNVGYNYNKFIVDKKANIIEKLYNEVANYTYNKDLETLTADEDSRLYKEFYNNYTKNDLLAFVEKTLVNNGYMPTFNSDILDNLITESLVDTKKINEMLYAYNYFKYWYNIDFNGINMADSLMFYGNQMFDIRMTMENIAKELVNSGAKTGATGGFYNNYLAKYTRLNNLGYLFDYYIGNFTDYKTSDLWLKDRLKNQIFEEVDIGYDDTYYTYFDHLRNNSNVQNTFLPVLTVPDNSMYIITMPTQIMYGSLRIYAKDPTNREAKDMVDFLANVETLKRQAKNFYTFARKFAGYENMNPYHDIEYDMRSTYDDNGIVVFNNPGQTTDNYHKYFAEAVNKWPASNGSGAYANGFEVYWNVIKLIGSFPVATHETLHNQDSKVFLQGYGRRGDSEDYTAGNLQQYYNPGWISPNVMEDFEDTKDITQNFTIERIDTNDKLKDFYAKLIDTNDFLDYIEAQAFLELQPEEQAKLCVQVYYPELENESEAVKKAGDSKVGYRLVSADEIRKMHLKDMSDLWDNQIMLKPGVKETVIGGPGAATDSLYNIRWYQPHADNSRPDGPNFKWLAWEMAGIGGYYDGYIAYYSQTYIGKHTNRPDLKTTDLEALRYITGNSTITFREYKLKRYEKMKSMWDNDDYVDAEAIKAEFKAALLKDTNDTKYRKLGESSAVKKKYYQALKRQTKDFRISIFDKNGSAKINNTKDAIPKIADEKPIINSSSNDNEEDNAKEEDKQDSTNKEITNFDLVEDKKILDNEEDS